MPFLVCPVPDTDWYAIGIFNTRTVFSAYIHSLQNLVIVAVLSYYSSAFLRLYAALLILLEEAGKEIQWTASVGGRFFSSHEERVIIIIIIIISRLSWRN